MAGTKPELQRAASVESSRPTRAQAVRTKLRRWQEHWAFAYVMAVLAPFLAAWVHHLLWLVGLKLTYVTFYIAIILASLLGGLGPGFLATLISALLADYFFLQP